MCLIVSLFTRACLCFFYVVICWYAVDLSSSVGLLFRLLCVCSIGRRFRDRAYCLSECEAVEFCAINCVLGVQCRVPCMNNRFEPALDRC